MDRALRRPLENRRILLPRRLHLSDEEMDQLLTLRYAISQRLRKRIEECFGWGKTVAGLAQLKVRGLDKVRAVFVFNVAAYNLVRLPSSWLRRANCVQRRKEEAKMTQRRGPFLRMSSSQAKNFAPAHPLAEAQ